MSCCCVTHVLRESQCVKRKHIIHKSFFSLERKQINTRLKTIQISNVYTFYNARKKENT